MFTSLILTHERRVTTHRGISSPTDLAAARASCLFQNEPFGVDSRELMFCFFQIEDVWSKLSLRDSVLPRRSPSSRGNIF